MSRLIDADILKEAFIVNTDRKGNLVADPEVIIDNAPTVPLPDFKEGYKQAIRDGKTNFSRPQGRWIPVSERLPEEEGDYLVQTYNGGIFIDHFVNGFAFDFFVFYKSNVIAWQPLPEPYKVESEADNGNVF